MAEIEVSLVLSEFWVLTCGFGGLVGYCYFISSDRESVLSFFSFSRDSTLYFRCSCAGLRRISFIYHAFRNNDTYAYGY